MVTKAGKYYVQPFITGRGVTQGDPFFPTLFIIIVDAVFRATLKEIFGPLEAQHGFGWSTGEHNICFYADDGQISGRDLVWVHTALTKMVTMFERFSCRKT